MLYFSLYCLISSTVCREGIGKGGGAGVDFNEGECSDPGLVYQLIRNNWVRREWNREAMSYFFLWWTLQHPLLAVPPSSTSALPASKTQFEEILASKILPARLRAEQNTTFCRSSIQLYFHSRQPCSPTPMHDDDVGNLQIIWKMSSANKLLFSYSAWGHENSILVYYTRAMM